MANRLEQNVIIIDSAMGNVVIFGTSSQETTTSAIRAGSGFHQYVISAVAADLQSNSASALTLAGENTTNVIVQVNRFNPLVHFATPLRLSCIKPIAVVGTAYVYLS